MSVANYPIRPVDRNYQTGIHLPGGNVPFVVHTRAPSLEKFLVEFTSWVVLPAKVNPPPSRLPNLIKTIRHLTGWSIRTLAQVLGTSHTTVRMLETTGRATTRSREAAGKVRPLFSVLSRLSEITNDPGGLAVALETPNDFGVSALDKLKSGDWAEAYVVGLDAINGPRPDMLIPDPTWQTLPGTRELH